MQWQLGYAGLCVNASPETLHEAGAYEHVFMSTEVPTEPHTSKCTGCSGGISTATGRVTHCTQ